MLDGFVVFSRLTKRERKRSFFLRYLKTAENTYSNGTASLAWCCNNVSILNCPKLVSSKNKITF